MYLSRLTYENLRSGTNAGTLVLRADLTPGTMTGGEIAELIIQKTSNYASRVPFYFPLDPNVEFENEDDLEDVFNLLSGKRKIITKTSGMALFKWYRFITWITTEANTSGYAGVFSNEVHLQLRDIDKELPFTPDNIQRYVDLGYLTIPEEGFKLISTAIQDWRILTVSRELFRKGIYDVKENAT